MEVNESGLPANVADAVLNRGELARALNKSEPTIDRYIADGMPYLTEGTNGRSYEFQLSDCWRWLKDRERVDAEKRSAAEQAVQQMRLALVGAGDVGDEDRQLSPKQRQEAYDAERAFMLAAMQRGDLVRRADVVGAFEEVFKIVRDVLTALPDKIEREAGLTGKSIEVAIDVCDGSLLEIERLVNQATGAEDLRQAAE
jgi:phage terminase Nu1 subunit (DNA packaging protein)